MNHVFAHLCGDYLCQSDWKAREKVRSHRAALAHVATYLIPFLFLRPGWKTLGVIGGTHFLIDRYRLARYVCWAKNWLAPKGEDHTLTATGYAPSTPPWLATWLLIITDNVIHIGLNALALRRR